MPCQVIKKDNEDYQSGVALLKAQFAASGRVVSIETESFDNVGVKHYRKYVNVLYPERL